MSKTAKLQKGENVTVNIPFTYTIGEPGPITWGSALFKFAPKN